MSLSEDGRAIVSFDCEAIELPAQMLVPYCPPVVPGDLVRVRLESGDAEVIVKEGSQPGMFLGESVTTGLEGWYCKSWVVSSIPGIAVDYVHPGC